MAIDRGMDKEDVVYTHNEILLNYKKGQNWVICTDMDGHREYHTERSKLEKKKKKEKNKYHILTHIHGI